MTRKTSPERGLIRETAAEYRVVRRISATDAARNFSDLLNRVRYRGESFVIERNGEAVGELRPAAPAVVTGADLLRLMSSLPRVDEEFLAEVEGVARTQPTIPDSPWDP